VLYDAASGQQLWAAFHDGPANGADEGTAAALSADRAFVAGTVAGGATGDDAVVVAYGINAAGAPLWSASYDGFGGADRAVGMALAPDGGRVYVAASSAGPAGSGYDYVTLAYDAATGSLAWTSRYNGPASGEDLPKAVAASPDGSRVFVTGRSIGSGTGHDFATVAYNAATGAHLWTARYDGPGHGFDGAEAISVTPDGSSVAVGGVTTAGEDAFGTVVYAAATGAQVWAATENPGAMEAVSAVTVSPDGTKVFVTGEAQRPFTFRDIPTFAYAASDGARLWSAWYAQGGHDAAYDMRATASAVLLTGASLGSGTGTDVITAAYAPSNGAQLWAERYHVPGNTGEWANAIVAHPDGTKAYVTGPSANLVEGVDWLTIAYPV
jgi:hypothetical protein